jgi:serine/threonine-protein kinase
MKCESCGHDNVEGARFCAKCGAAVPVAVIGQADPLIGQVIGGRFHVTGVLGEGGMGIVYAGEQQMGTTVRKVAVKTLHAHLSKDASVMARFHREVGTVAQLEHPNTIKVYDFGSTKDGTLYIAMEFVSGRSLAEVILKEGALAPDRVVHIMRQVCGALDEAHNQGIVHRDLKPENIILTQRAGETDFVKVLDFGIAARTESADAQKEAKLTQQGMVLGTPPYMSPEQFTGKQLDARSDVYSLGVMAYEMLTGQLPFDAETPWEWATQHMTAAPKAFEVVAPSKHIPEGLRQAILRSLSKERTQRQDSARQFFEELSGGARMTIEASAVGSNPGVAAMGYQATAAMPAVPGQGGPAAPGGYAPTAMQPQVSAPAARVHTPANTPGAVAAVPIPPPKKSSGSGKGLVLGLGGLGLVLVVAIVIVIVRSNQPDDVGPLTAPTGAAALTPAVVTGETPATDAPVAANNPPAGQTPAANVKPSSGSKPGSGASAGKGGAPSAAGGAPASGTQPASTQPASTQPTGGGSAACTQCVTQASAGNIAGALASYRSCSDAGEKAKCTSAARAPAMKAARAAAQGGQCDQARAIVSAAQQMGAGTPINPLRGTTCEK